LRSDDARRPTLADEGGSATVLVLGLAMALVLLATALATGIALAGAGQRARTAADLAVLAVADRVGQLDACSVGAEVAAANGARLISCATATSRVRVAVSAPLPWGGEVRREAAAIPGS
jgi:secretion/DNA translocation related TadE-like protein